MFKHIAMKAKSNLQDWFCDDCSKRIASELLLHRLSKSGLHYNDIPELKNALQKFVALVCVAP